MSNFNRTIDDLIAQRTLAEFYRDFYTDEPLVGVPVTRSSELLLLLAIDEHGQSEGLTAIQLRSLTRVRWGGNVLDAAESLWLSAAPVPPHYSQVDLSNIGSALVSVDSLFGYVVVYTEQVDPRVCYIGELENLSHGSLVLHVYGTFKSRDRSRLLLRSENVTRVSGGGIYEESLLRLLSEE